MADLVNIKIKTPQGTLPMPVDLVDGMLEIPTYIRLESGGHWELVSLLPYPTYQEA